MNNQAMQLEELKGDFNMTNQFLRFDISEAMEKSVEGRQRRILGGYAAGTTKDFQDEKFLLKGMNFSYLSSNQGRINWDHNPDLLIGRPVQSGMLEKGLYVKGMLSERQDYPHPTHPNTIAALDRAEWAWDQAMRHRADPLANAPLAWSVEGKKMIKGGVIEQSLVTDVALTDKAVNPHDCTVSAMAKSIREEIEKEVTEEIAIHSGLALEEIDYELSKIKDHESMLKFGKSIGLSVDHTVNLYHIIRGL